MFTVKPSIKPNRNKPLNCVKRKLSKLNETEYKIVSVHRLDITW